jgi:tRNA-uridine 2-sulfurtransferase
MTKIIKDKKDITVAVGMSGGVDSSVAAYLLKKEGYNVIGLFMKNWDEDESKTCQSAIDFDDVIKVCNHLKIPVHNLNFCDKYFENVFKPFLEGYKNGFTPNPDILCNKEIKFNVFLEKALELGADFLATGHYCQNILIDNKNHLTRGEDENKDQSYFLYTIKSHILKKVKFPIGHLKKDLVRQIAIDANIPTATKKESMGICFIGKRNFKPFLNKYIGFNPGNFEDTKGKLIGQHDGMAFYTIGQRKGLKIGGEGPAWFVVGKDISRNVVIIDQGENHSALMAKSLVAKDISWVTDQKLEFPYKCSAKIRYRQKDENCTIEKIENDKIFVTFDDPQRAITPMQSIVFYKDNVCLGGAVIIDKK